MPDDAGMTDQACDPVSEWEQYEKDHLISRLVFVATHAGTTPAPYCGHRRSSGHTSPVYGGRRHQLLDLGGTTGRAGRCGVTHFMKGAIGVRTGGALVIVGRHRRFLNSLGI